VLEESKKSDLVAKLKNIRIHPDDAQDLFRMLEDEQQLDSRYLDGVQYASFCKAYTIKLIQFYVPNGHEQDALLVAYGFLKEYGLQKRVIARRVRYSERAVGVNPDINPSWANPEDNLGKYEEEIIEKLADRLIEEATNNSEHKGWLGFTKKVEDELAEQFHGRLPKEGDMPLPVPRYRDPSPVDDPDASPEPPTPERSFLDRLEALFAAPIDIKKAFILILISVVLAFFLRDPKSLSLRLSHQSGNSNTELNFTVAMGRPQPAPISPQEPALDLVSADGSQNP
jgi:hypothetical protein